MTEFRDDWVGWQFAVDHEEIGEVMARPDGGLALVEVDARPRELVRNLGAHAAKFLTGEYSGRNYYLTANVGDMLLAKTVPEFVDDVDDFLLALKEVIEPARKSLGALKQPTHMQLILGIRHEHQGHTDFGAVTAWCGADRPGFFVVRDGKKIPIPELPEGHVLLMRSKDNEGLEGVRHGVIYRSKTRRRAVMLGY